MHDVNFKAGARDGGIVPDGRALVKIKVDVILEVPFYHGERLSTDVAFSMLKRERFPPIENRKKQKGNTMSKMNYRRGGKGAKRGKHPDRDVPDGFVIMAKRLHRRAIRRAGKVEISSEMADLGDYVPELKARDCIRIARKSARAIAVWMYI